MAVTFPNTTRPDFPAGKFLPSANPINITVDSNNTGKINFRYVCDIWIDGLFQFRFKLFPDPSTGYGFFQLNEVISDYLTTYNPKNNTSGITVATNSAEKSIVSVVLKFGEEYDNSLDGTAGVQIYPNLLISNQFWVYIGAFDYRDYPSYNYNEWRIATWNTVAPIKFLTNRPRAEFSVNFSDSYYLDILASVAPTSGSSRLVIVRDDATSLLLNAPLLASSGKYRIACGPHDINRATGTTFIDNWSTYYDVHLETGANQVSEKIRFFIKPQPHFHSRIGWTGQLGSPEYYTFYHKRRESWNIDKRDYKKYLTSNIGGVMTYAVGDREMTTYAKNVTKVSNVQTFITEDLTPWFSELWLSSNVWIEVKPSIMKWRIFREDSTPTSRMLFWVTDNTLVAGDQFFAYPDRDDQSVDYRARFTVSSVVGNIVDCGLTFNIYNITETASGCLVKDELAMRIPVVPIDGTAEIKRKETGQIVYAFNYVDSVSKVTI